MANTRFVQAATDNFLFYKAMAKYYNHYSLPVKPTPHQVITQGCQILMCSCLTVKLKLYIYFFCSFCKDLLSLQT